MRAAIRHAAAVLVGLLLVSTWVWWSAGSASAGGPTSVIMVNPDTGGAAALHTTDARYGRLVDAVRAYETPTGPTTRPASVTDCSGCQIRLTWLIHDMRVWRIDRVHLTPDDGTWLESVSDEKGGDVFARTGVWQRPHDATVLLGLLGALGVTKASAGSAGGHAEIGTSGGGETGVVAGGTTGASSGLAVVGAGIAGVAAGFVIGWHVRRHRSGTDRVVLSG